MKKELLIASLFACGAAVAGEFTSKTTGILKCTSSTKETIVSIPWVGYGEAADIKVNEIVRTTGLENGDKLLAPDGAGGYDSWTLSGGAWVADNKTTIDPGGSDTRPGADASKTLDRGDGFWLVKNDSYEAGTEFNYYLLGQKPESASVSKELTKTGWHLLSNAGDADKKVSEIVTGPMDGDLVIKADGSKYVRGRSKSWKKFVNGTASEDATDATIKAGEGFWLNKINSGTSKLSL